MLPLILLLGRMEGEKESESFHDSFHRKIDIITLSIAKSIEVMKPNMYLIQ